MSEEVEATVGCVGMLLVFVGLVWVIATVPAFADFVGAIPAGVVVMAVGLLMVIGAVTNRRER